MALWWMQLILNFGWSPIFFSAHRIGLALVVLVLLVIANVGFVIAKWSSDRTAAWLFVPYVLWTMFATALNAGVVLLN